MTLIGETYDLGTHFAADALEVERRFLTTFWHFPEEGHGAACDAGLTAGTFSIDDHCALFTYLGESVEQGVPISYGNFNCVRQHAGISITNVELEDIAVWGANWTEDPRGDLPDLALIIVENARRRGKARKLLKEVRSLLRGQEAATTRDITKKGVPHVRRRIAV